MILLGLFFSLLLFFSFFYLFFTLFAVWRFSKRTAEEKRVEGKKETPPVTVFKPVRGVTPASEELFRTFLNQNYPKVQLLFGVQDPQDPVIPILEKLKKEAPLNVEMTIVVNSDRVGSNPKISNLYNMSMTAKYDIFVISDSDIMVSPDYLKHIVDPFAEPEVGVVTAIYKAKLTSAEKIKEKLVMALEALGLSVSYMPSVLAAAALGKTGFAFGQTMAVRRRTLEAIGGWKSLANCNSDDYQLGARAQKAGFRVFLSPHWVENVISPESFKDFFTRRVRWARVICICETWGYLGSAITYLLPLAFLHLLAWRGDAFGWFVLFLAVTAKISVAFASNRILLKDTAVYSYWWLIPFLEFVEFAVWCWGWLPLPVVWYGEKYILKRDGTAVRIH